MSIAPPGSISATEDNNIISFIVLGASQKEIPNGQKFFAFAVTLHSQPPSLSILKSNF
jgi:hypothetical protein